VRTFPNSFGDVAADNLRYGPGLDGPMLYRRILDILLMTAVCVASGTLECSHPHLSETQRHGQELYGRMCAVCHGRGGEGYSADQAPALSHPDFLASVTDVYLRNAISFGRPGTTMSAWSTARSGPLVRGDIEAVISFIRSWEQKPRAALDERPLAGEINRGQGIYAEQCNKCHGARGVGGPNIHIGSPQLLADAGNGFLRQAIRGGRPGTLMPSFEHTLGETGIEDVVALVRSWQGANASALQLPPPPAPTPPLPLGPVPLNPRGPAPVGLRMFPATTPGEIIKGQLDRKARIALLDARAPSDYVNSHIAGAVSVPFYDPEPYLALLPKDTWLVCYCACPHAESSTLAQKLVAKGFSKVTVLDEGLGFWANKNYGIHKGTEP
jgi:cytochrome c oxidase cbb3-type subunit 3/ubiquinol-cytochrome c reductase cytochrome c subunit